VFECAVTAGSGEFGDVYKAKWHGSFVSPVTLDLDGLPCLLFYYTTLISRCTALSYFVCLAERDRTFFRVVPRSAIPISLGWKVAGLQNTALSCSILYFDAIVVCGLTFCFSR
jgi:hypothetical protein